MVTQKTQTMAHRLGHHQMTFTSLMMTKYLMFGWINVFVFLYLILLHNCS